MKRIKTYIKGFDELIEGGFPQDSSILLSGNPGTGKTIFSLEYLYNGALKDGEIGIYFTFEEKKKSLLEQAKQFGFDFEKYEKKGLLNIISIGSKDISLTTIEYIEEIIVKSKAKRVVIDSLTTLSYLTPEHVTTGDVTIFSIKKFLYDFITTLKNKSGTHFLCVSQKEDQHCDKISRYLCDGVIDIEYESLGGEYSRSLSIKKMRKTKNNDDLHSLEIKDKEGIIIHSLD